MSDVAADSGATDEQRFESLIGELAENAHGTKFLGDVRSFIKDEFNAEERYNFLSPRLVRDPIEWELVKDRVWENEPDRTKNKFPFIQGDIVSTSLVLELGSSQSPQAHNLWMVLSPDCDCARASFIRVAKVFTVPKDDTGRLRDKLRLAFQLATWKVFPIPPTILDNSSDLYGHFADMEVPYYIRKADIGAATPIASLQIEAWHLLNAILQDGATRADVQESVRLRS